MLRFCLKDKDIERQRTDLWQLRTGSGHVSLIRDSNRVSQRMPDAINPSVSKQAEPKHTYGQKPCLTVLNPHYDNISEICARNDACDGSDVMGMNQTFGFLTLSYGGCLTSSCCALKQSCLYLWSQISLKKIIHAQHSLYTFKIQFVNSKHDL